MNPGLLVLAAGMGSRFGGIKQIEAVGPQGEIILEYSVFDALRAGFDHVVFVIRRDIEKDFVEQVLPRFQDKIRVDYVFQDLQDLPEGFLLPEGRKKPWGTGHAILRSKAVLSEPFAVINADDFYGAQAFEVIARELKALDPSATDYCMVAYDLEKTISKNGSVSRGVCSVNEDQYLKDVVENKKIFLGPQGLVNENDDGVLQVLEAKTPVSMNLFGFTPRIFAELELRFAQFLKEQISNSSAEFYIPSAVNSMIHEGLARLKVLRSNAQWYGITYKADLPEVKEGIATLHQQKVYPSSLWS